MSTDNLFGGDLLLETGTNEIQLVEFTLRGQSFGVNVDKIQQIIEMPEVTFMPENSEFISGAFEFREHVLALIDLKKCLVFEGNEEESDDVSQKVVVMDFNGVMNGFLVDDVKRLHRLSWEQIETPNIMLGDNYELYIIGIIKFSDRICIMIDFEKIVGSINPELSIRHIPKIDFKEERKGKKIVFAEDSQFVRGEVKEILETAGYQVETAGNGEEALRILEAYSSRAKSEEVGIEKFVNLIITDIEMPKMDGRYLTRKIKEDPILKKIPVFLFTSMSGMWSQVKAETIGADGLISKPEIHSMVEKLDKFAL